MRLHVQPNKNRENDATEGIAKEYDCVELQLPQPTFEHADIMDNTVYHNYHYVVGEKLLNEITMKKSLFVGQHVWVCKSKGTKNITSKVEQSHVSRYELFLRAVIVDEEMNHRTITEISTNVNRQNTTEHRIRVQYPMGSTYLVRSDQLVPILNSTYLEQLVPTLQYCNLRQDNICKHGMVLVYPETNAYRRACVTHTMPYDHFIEIGCAEGKLCNRIYETNRVQHRRTDTRNNRIILGIDKSTSSVQIAQKKYVTEAAPNLFFVVLDVLKDAIISDDQNHDESTDRSCRETDSYATILLKILKCFNRINTGCHKDDQKELDSSMMVVAIDINGNRDINPVKQCIQIVMDRLCPRLIIVKSRSLYHEINT